MSFIQKGPLCLFLISSLVLLQGCWNQIEVNRLAIVSAVGLDQADKHHIQVTVEVIVPGQSGGSGGKNSSGGPSKGKTKMIRTAKGKTLSSAIENLQKKMSRKIFFGQTEIIVFGESLARSGVNRQLDFFSRSPESRLNLYPFVCKGNANKILSLSPALESRLSEVVTNESDYERIRRITLNNLLQGLGSYEETAVIPWVQMASDQTTPYLDGDAILKKGELIGTTNNKETKSISLIRNNLSQTNLDVNMGPNEFVSLKLIHCHAKLIPKIKNGKWEMTIQIQAVADALQNSTAKDLSNVKMIGQIQKQADKQIRNEIYQTIEKSQNQWRADVFQFSRIFERKYPKQWTNVKSRWKQVIFPSLKTKVMVHVKVERQGINSSPPGIPKKGEL